jgi:undecaprenyl-diphosphatase
MQALNHELFLLLNAPVNAHGTPVLVATFFATYLIYLLPIGLVWLAITGDAKDRRAMTSAVLTALLALLLGFVISTVWPQLRPFAIPLGTNLLPHVTDAGFPSDHALVFFGLGFGMLLQARLAWAAVPLMAAGVMVGWARIYLGVHFPADIVGAVPVALVGALLVRSATGCVSSCVADPLEAIYQRLRRATLKARMCVTGSKHVRH